MAEPGTFLADRYRLVREVGRGGMGVVWEAWDERLERPVAIKELQPQPGLSPEEAELAKNRAMREARITARLHHRNAVPVFDVVEHEGQPCLVMQFLPSVPLSAVLRESGPLGVHEAAKIGAQVASALAAAHELGIVHRDVKPGNILIADDGTALISDFGISRALGDATLTSTGLVHGTPAYLAPEVARGAESSHASDVFSLGATLYACLEGGPPFGTDSNSIALLYKVASGRVRAAAAGRCPGPGADGDAAARPRRTPDDAGGRGAARRRRGRGRDPGRDAADPGGAAVRRRGPVLRWPPRSRPGRPRSVPSVGPPVGPPQDPPPGRRRRRGAWVAVAALLVGLVVLGTAAAPGPAGVRLGRPGPATSRSAASTPSRSASGSTSSSPPSTATRRRATTPSRPSRRPRVDESRRAPRRARRRPPAMVSRRRPSSRTRSPATTRWCRTTRTRPGRG